MIQLRCGCKVTDEGTFIVGANCQGCRECNTVSKLHPFSSGRFVEEPKVQ